MNNKQILSKKQNFTKTNIYIQLYFSTFYFSIFYDPLIKNNKK